MSNINPNINKFFNKLYASFPSIVSINKSKEFGNMRYVYKTRDSTKWFVKYKTDQEVFLFGKIKDDTPQPPLLTLTFDKTSAYSKDCSGIINAKNVYINVKYFIDNYPNFKTSLNESTIDVFNNSHVNSINVIKIGNYIDNIDNLIDNLNTLLNELDEFKPIAEPKPDKDNKSNDRRTCEICGKKLKNDKFKLCKKCSRKRNAANILVNLLKYVEPQTPFEKNDLKQVYENEMEIKHCIWSLVEFNLVTTNNNEYCLVNPTKLKKFIEEYGTVDEIPFEKEEEKKEEPKKLNKQCSICKKTLPTSKFYTSNKTDDGLEDYCKKCKKLVFAANCLKEILNQVSPGSEFKINDLKNNFKNPLEYTGRLYELQHNDLLFYDSDKDTYLLADLKTCQNFLDKYYIDGSISIKPEIKKEDDIEELTEEQQMDNVIESIKNGKTDKEASEIAGINLYKISHWFNEGKNNSDDKYTNFYNQYNINTNNDKNIFNHILDPISSEYIKRFKKPNSSGFAWVKKISSDTWGYTNPKDNVRIYENNIYNLYITVKKQNLPWGVHDLEKAKKSLAECKKPNIPTKSPIEKETTNFKNSEVTCICFEENNNAKIIINGLIENDKFLNTLYKFKSYENNIKKIISDRHTQSTELFIELELEKNRLDTFKDRIRMYGWKIIN